MIPTSRKQFAEETGIDVDALVAGWALAEFGASPHLDSRWFMACSADRILWLYANRKPFREWLLKAEDGREYLEAWLRHWLAAYQYDPENYKARHTPTSLGVAKS